MITHESIVLEGDTVEIRITQHDWMAQLAAEADRRYEAVNWTHGKWYAIYDEDESAGGAELYECHIEDGEVYLIADQAECDSWCDAECYVARTRITSRSVIVPQH